ncbi:hypothetical protein IscW_ISCW004294, partial [Ixodes scapularis]
MPAESLARLSKSATPSETLHPWQTTSRLHSSGILRLIKFHQSPLSGGPTLFTIINE